MQKKKKEEEKNTITTLATVGTKIVVGSDS